MEKRFQVFVSSTYDDLRDERKEVMQALLELDCIPSGMELFPAANDSQWDLIKSVIDDCDYYLVIVGGRYGTPGPDGVGYTEAEYRYALEHGKPVMGFLHKNPGTLPHNRCEKTEEGRTRLEAFRSLVKQKVCRLWESPAELGSQVSRSLVKMIKNEPAIGWVRADLVPDESAAKEILKYQRRVAELEGVLSAVRSEAPPGTQELAQGEDEFPIRYSFEATMTKTFFSGPPSARKSRSRGTTFSPTCRR